MIQNAKILTANIHGTQRVLIISTGDLQIFENDLSTSELNCTLKVVRCCEHSAMFCHFKCLWGALESAHYFST